MAERKTCSSGPRRAQHPANFPSITTAGTLRTPYCFALEATSDFCISWTTTSCEDPARRFTTSIVSLHVEQPALKTSIFFFVAILVPPFLLSSSNFFAGAFWARCCFAGHVRERPRIPQRSENQ